VSVALKAWLRPLGSILAVVGCAWVVWQFAHQEAWSRLASSAHWGALIRGAAVAVPVYLLGLCLVATAWCLLQNALLESSATYGRLFPVYATTQFAKYTPGNVAHYVGRHVLLRRIGLGHVALLFGTLAEASMLVVAAMAWAWPALPQWRAYLTWSPSIAGCLLIAWLLIYLGTVLLSGLRARSRWLQMWTPPLRPMAIARVFPLYCAFFCCMALAMEVPAHALVEGGVPLPLLAMAAAASWVAGFLVVGAPAGLGVREAVFLLLLRGQLAQEDILVLAATFRVISFAGDVGLLLIGVVATRMNFSGAARGDVGTDR